MAIRTKGQSQARSTRDSLNERQHTHGDYSENAEINQEVKTFFRGRAGWANLNFAQRDAIDAISGKISRILSGNPHERDHWDDIAGYATLAADRCEDA